LSGAVELAGGVAAAAPVLSGVVAGAVAF